MTETSTYTHQELSARLAEVERERDAMERRARAFQKGSSNLLAERNDLAAMVGRLRQGMYEMAEDLHSVRCGPDGPVSDCLPPCYNETPPTALAEIRAEAVEAAAKECKMLVLDGPNMHSECLADYAQQLRNGASQ